MRLLFASLLMAALALLSCGCSLKRMAMNSMANTLAEGGDVFTRDDDPELVRDALPFGLKTMEALLEEVPRHRALLLAACQGFTQYAYAFVQMEADKVEPVNYEEASRLRSRALRLFLRARDFGLRGLEVDHRGVTARLQSRPEDAVRPLGKKQVGLLYWTAAAWGSAINLGKDRADLAADISAVKALLLRGLELDETFEEGALHEAMIVIEALPAAMGGSPARARRHFARALELSGGSSPAPYLTLAQSVTVAEQNRAEFRELLGKALAVDPDQKPSRRLATLLIQRKARELLAREDDLFLEPDTTTGENSR
jgi:predicted anti-sigma-YlaC factor YlaD